MRKIKNLIFLKKGFTLLELLVVIGIIAVLIGVGAVSYSTAQKKARDAKRRSDLKTVQNCMEQYYTTNSYQYQDLGSDGDDLNASDTIQCGGGKTLVVVDPINTTTYKYVITNTSAALYKITATLEGGGTFVVENLQ
ncbi:MAG: prepilin-type N-terminal cleavage/methylation domain-containing protein [Candidatus Roizmanbacteria bacterium]|nr:MAG: prepilin-type N-terminal cleavage/methylation domain-containing protein [Candidatus Roizmanbacteria bacterium]